MKENFFFFNKISLLKRENFFNENSYFLNYIQGFSAADNRTLNNYLISSSAIKNFSLIEIFKYKNKLLVQNNQKFMIYVSSRYPIIKNPINENIAIKNNYI